MNEERTKMHEQYLIGFFHENEENGCFSNWYPAEFDYAGIHYKNSEQYMMYQKVCQFGFYNLGEHIMRISEPQECKNMAGKKNAPADEAQLERWHRTRYSIVKRGVKAKFAQNPNLLDALLGTGAKLMAECSPYDKLWGIGIDVNDPDRFDVSKWKGSNFLGVILMEVREELRQELLESNSETLIYIDYHDAAPIPEWEMTAGELKRIPQYFKAIHAYADTLGDAQIKNVFYNEFSLYDWEIAMNTNMGGGLPVAGFFEMKQEVYEIARRLQHKQFVSDIFREDPPIWGLRGMPYFWNDLRMVFAFDDVSMSPDELEARIHHFYEWRTHEPLTRESRCFVEEYAHGGMSSGYLSGEILIDNWIPMLKERLAAIKEK